MVINNDEKSEMSTGTYTRGSNNDDGEQVNNQNTKQKGTK